MDYQLIFGKNDSGGDLGLFCFDVDDSFFFHLNRFHVDNLSSAHVYLRMKDAEQTIDDIPVISFFRSDMSFC
jgi:hypothetical protein